ncbi:MAG: peptidase M50, partial [Desulfobacterales bacterium]|nr:peptidase M50 [Desulfobacterales bacterium]
MIMAFTPIPYVEASSSAAFADKRKRMAVAAVGMAVELLIACIALVLWLNIEPGLVSAIAYNIILIGGVSTILFNGNPLLRFDGYYVLADGIEIPNLGQRSIQYLGYLIQRYLVGVENVRSPVSAQGEGKWFFFYGILSFTYRTLILIGLILFISNKFFFIGMLIAVWGITTQFVLPSVRNCSRFINSAGGRSKQGRLLLVGLGLLIVIGAVMFA